MYGTVNDHKLVYSMSMTSVSLASIIELSGAASFMSDSVILCEESLLCELLMPS